MIPATAVIAPGLVTLTVENTLPRRAVLGVAQLPAQTTKPPLTFRPFLSGKRLVTTQTFRDLFRAEVIGATEGIGVRDVALLFTDLKGSTALYERIGDLTAFALVQRHFEKLRDVTARNGGALVKTIGDAVMAAFADPLDALRAALAMLEETAAFNQAAARPDLVLKIGVHHGPAIAVTLNDRLDYFGQTVNIAARIQGLAEAAEIFVSEDVRKTPGADALLEGLSVEERVAQLRGVGQEMTVFRLVPGV